MLCLRMLVEGALLDAPLREAAAHSSIGVSERAARVCCGTTHDAALHRGDRHTAAPINYFGARTGSGSATMWRTPARSGLSSVLVVRRSSRLMLFCFTRVGEFGMVRCGACGAQPPQIRYLSLA